MMIIVPRIKHKLRLLPDLVEDWKCKSLVRSYHIGTGFKRIYFYHIRKAAGTSLNHIFLSLSGKNAQDVYKNLADVSRNHRVIINGKIFVGWNKRLIESGNYFYAFFPHPLSPVRYS